MSDAHGRFVWYDLVTPDPAGATRFYREVVGWGTQQWEMGSASYTMWTNGEAPLGGIDVARGDVAPHWLAYVAVRDVDAATALARELGGTVVRGPEDIPAVGRFAILRDPQGAAFAVFRSSSPDMPETAPKRGDFSWHELATTDHAAAFDFYQRVLGWERTEAHDMGPMGTYQLYGRGGQSYGGMFDGAGESTPPSWLHYVQVDDVDRAAQAVARLGGKVLNGPMAVPGGDRVAQCLDPHGAPFAVHERRG